MENKISIQALQRLPYYLKYLEENSDKEYISASQIASTLELTEIQVRKDLAILCETRGIPNKGFYTKDLISGINKFLGYDNSKDAILIGAGNLGKALLSYNGFEKYGINIVAAFDNNEKIIGKKFNSKEVFSIKKLKSMTKRLKIHLAILTVPDEAAQEIVDVLVESGVLAIWNFTSVHLITPKDILVKEENLASSLSILSNYVSNKILKVREEEENE